MQRGVFITEEFGVYKLSCRGGAVVTSGKSCEDVLLKAANRVVRPDFDMKFEADGKTTFAGELVELLLGPGNADGLEASVRA